MHHRGLFSRKHTHVQRGTPLGRDIPLLVRGLPRCSDEYNGQLQHDERSLQDRESRLRGRTVQTGPGTLVIQRWTSFATTV